MTRLAVSAIMVVLYITLPCSLCAQNRRKMLLFGEHLKLPQELELTREAKTNTVIFRWPETWQLLAGSSLHLFITHSPGLDGDRSFLSVSLNYGVLRSVRLGQPSVQEIEVVVPLPETLIRDENEFAFSADLFTQRAAETDLRVRISTKSFVDVHYRERPGPVDLGRFPFCFLDPNPYSPSRLAILRPEGARSPSLEGIGLLVGTFALRIRPRELQARVVKTVSAAGTDPLLVVGMPEEHAQAGKLLHSEVSEMLRDEGGVVALLQASGVGRGPILMVTGRSSRDVLAAARHVAAGGRLSGKTTRVGKDARPGRIGPREWLGFMPRRNGFSLSDLGVKETAIRASHGFALTVNLNAPPDVHFLPYEHRMSLNFRLNPEFYDPTVTLRIELNGVRLAEPQLSEVSKGYSAHLSLNVPSELLGAANQLKVTWLRRESSTGLGIAAWIEDDSAFYFPRYYETKLPDLSLLRVRLFPFSLSPDFGDVIVTVPDQAAQDLLSAVVECARVVGRAAPGERLAFQVKRTSELSRQDRQDSHLIVLQIEGATNPSMLTTLKPLPNSRAFRGLPTIRETLSPWNQDKCILTLEASSPDKLAQAVRSAFSEPLLNAVQLDAAYLTAARAICFRLEPQRAKREYSLAAMMEAWLRTYWLALPAVLTLVSVLLFVVLRLMLRQYRSTAHFSRD